MAVYEAGDYRAVVKGFLKAEKVQGRKGGVKRLAAALKCHTTYISQVIRGKADFSPDQGLLFCQFAGMGSEPSEYFMDLLLRDRSGTAACRAHYQARIDRRLAELADMKKRWHVETALSVEQELLYYASWVTQVVHMFTGLKGRFDADTIARELAMDPVHVQRILGDLVSLGFVEEKAGRLKLARYSVHLGRESPLIRHYHGQWRQKAAADIAASPDLPGTHYSSVVSLSEKDAGRIRDLILEHLDKVRDIIIPSPSETLYAYNMDFYRLYPGAHAMGRQPAE